MSRSALVGRHSTVTLSRMLELSGQLDDHAVHISKATQRHPFVLDTVRRAHDRHASVPPGDCVVDHRRVLRLGSDDDDIGIDRAATVDRRDGRHLHDLGAARRAQGQALAADRRACAGRATSTTSAPPWRSRPPITLPTAPAP